MERRGDLSGRTGEPRLAWPLRPPRACPWWRGAAGAGRGTRWTHEGRANTCCPSTWHGGAATHHHAPRLTCGHVSKVVGASINLSMSLRGFVCVPSSSLAPPMCGGAAWRPESVSGRTGAAPYPATPPALALTPSAIRAPPLSEFCPALLWARQEAGSGGALPPLVRGGRRLERAVGRQARQGVHWLWWRDVASLTAGWLTWMDLGGRAVRRVGLPL